tara:strand:+ start:374 stop:1135 length:762 start_codon:yes stop_codon:yes gene_type:complete
MNLFDKNDIEETTKLLYEDIHPYTDIEDNISNYLKTLNIGLDFFKGKDILECGYGGTGWSIEMLVRGEARSIKGIDLNPKWQELYQEKYSNVKTDLDLRVGNLLDLPFEDESVDFATSYGVMHHTLDWKKGIEEMKRVLRPGGMLFIMVYGRYAPVGRLINKSLRIAGKVIPKKLMTMIVTKTGLFRDARLSILDTMYVPIELHLTIKEIKEFLLKNNFTDIKFYKSYKWENSFLSKPFIFGKNIQNNFSAIK